MGRIVLHWSRDGSFIYAAEDGVEVICIDERSAHDRVYRTVGEISAGDLDELIAADAQPAVN